MLGAVREWREAAVMKEEALVMLPTKEKTTIGGCRGGSPVKFNKGGG